MASAKFAELYSIAGTIKSAVFVGELPGNAAIVCMLLMTTNIKITSPQNNNNTQQDVLDKYKSDDASKVSGMSKVSKFNDANEKIDLLDDIYDIHKSRAPLP